MCICLDRCGWCKHFIGKLEGGKTYCEAYLNGINHDNCDIPGIGCANGFKFECKPEKLEMYKRCWGDQYYVGPFKVEECYEKFEKSGIPKSISLNGVRYFRVIGKLKRYYDKGPRVVLLLPLETFYVPGISKLEHLIDDIGNIIDIPNITYEPSVGLEAPYWKTFACLVEPIGMANEYCIGNYIRVLGINEGSGEKKQE